MLLDGALLSLGKSERPTRLVARRLGTTELFASARSARFELGESAQTRAPFVFGPREIDRAREP